MPAFCRFYPGMTPTAFRALSLDDFRSLNDYRIATLKAQETTDG
jgi:hypothetical protein